MPSIENLLGSEPFFTKNVTGQLLQNRLLSRLTKMPASRSIGETIQ